jgi:hypothetical protein
MELETICRVTMCDLRFEVGRQVDNANGAEWAFLRADTTSYAEIL